MVFSLLFIFKNLFASSPNNKSLGTLKTPLARALDVLGSLNIRVGVTIQVSTHYGIHQSGDVIMIRSVKPGSF